MIKQNRDYTKFTTTIDKSILLEAKEIAADNGQKISILIEKMLKDYIDKNKTKN